MRRELDIAIKNMKELKKRGVRVLPGGDYGFAWNPIGTNARDIEHFVNLLGFSPMDAILVGDQAGRRDHDDGQRAGPDQDRVTWPISSWWTAIRSPDVKLLQDADKLLAIMKDGAFHKVPQTAHAAQRQTA